ncbi:MAG TPA: clostripain-related cysteine peptidase, partial [Pyrinomonadaceae bacterium]|nr:clostripain-related cysteine peptidase [Pyrinomonadaceae bacterium]
FLLKDENPRGSLSIPDLHNVFDAIKKAFPTKKVNVLGMDVCLMSMGEVCYQLRGLVDFVVGAEGYSATAGWPYGDVLKKVLERKEVEAEDLSRLIVGQYTNYYSEYIVGGFSADMSAINVTSTSMDLFCRSVYLLTDLLNKQLLKGMKLKENGERSEFLDQIVMAHWEAQSYNGERYADLYDFCDLLEQRYAPRTLPEGASAEQREDNADRKALGQALCQVKQLIKDVVVVASCFSGVDYQFSYGISVYFPWSTVTPDYKNLRFAKESGWYDFLKTYTDATRRKPRGYKPVPPQHWANVEKFRTGEDRTGEDRGEPHPLYGNPVYSMRNPPLVPATPAGQSECLKEQIVAIESLDKSFFTKETLMMMHAEQ